MNDQLIHKCILQAEYKADFTTREIITSKLEKYISRHLSNMPSNLTVKGRVKSFNSFYKKALRYLREDKSTVENLVIPDIIGIRVICPFLEDTKVAEDIICNVFEICEIERKGSDYSFKEFGYESTHLLFKLPPFICGDYKKKNGNSFSGDIAEIQIRTILQDAWAEVEHELVYKAEFRPFDAQMKRKLASINASLSLADTIFQEIRQYQRQLNGQLEKRHESFFHKIEEQTDSFMQIDEPKKKKEERRIPREINHSSIDDLLLNALFSHNRGDFDMAIEYYSAIFDLKPDRKTESLIFKHRGMAYFAKSLYDAAINDFECALQIDGNAYQAAYYKGLVNLVLQRYDSAVEDFSKSILVNHYQAFCFYRRAEAYYHIDDFPAALSDCESALSVNNELSGAIKLKEILLKKLKM
ncbi:MAG: RelA/SpoT domain-containing protein [Termitinemataceae bacterium]|nr:MAG: RelA/SpoT domain-containing protein [Termitinemataceae bacterium]